MCNELFYVNTYHAIKKNSKRETGEPAFHQMVFFSYFLSIC